MTARTRVGRTRALTHKQSLSFPFVLLASLFPSLPPLHPLPSFVLSPLLAPYFNSLPSLLHALPPLCPLPSLRSSFSITLAISVRLSISFISHSVSGLQTKILPEQRPIIYSSPKKDYLVCRLRGVSRPALSLLNLLHFPLVTRGGGGGKNGKAKGNI